MTLILFIISFLFLGISIFLFLKKTKIDNQEKEKYQKVLDDYKKEIEVIQKEKDTLSIEIELEKKELNITKSNIDELSHRCNEEINKLNELMRTYDDALNNNKDKSNQAYEEYCSMLEDCYTQKELEYDEKVKALVKSLELQKEDIDFRIQYIQQQELEEQAILDKISATRAAAQEAVLREKEIKENKKFYCLSISENELADIKVLERIKPQLNKPRILSMLIWSTYWQKPMTALCNNVIGTTVKCGIYKITNQETTECYIGQAVDLARRWKDHAKCGLGIDTPAGNKLYNAIQEYGIWNFSWEILEECPRNELNEKEKYYIKLYQADKYGYNSTIGNKG